MTSQVMQMGSGDFPPPCGPDQPPCPDATVKKPVPAPKAKKPKGKKPAKRNPPSGSPSSKE